MKKLILLIFVLFLNINFAHAEQWVYLRMSPNAVLTGVMLDIDSIEFDDADNSTTFNILKDEEKFVFIHKIKYSYNNKKFAILESTKYNAWVTPENKVITHKFENLAYKQSEPGTASERLESLISDKTTIEILKNYANVNSENIRKQVGNSLDKLDKVKIIVWLDGSGKIYSYHYIFGNQIDSNKLDLLTNGENKLNYSVDIEYFPATEGKMSSFHVYKKSFNPNTKDFSSNSIGQTISSAFISRSMIPNMPSMARSVYEAQMPTNPDSSYGKLSNNDFFNKFKSTITNTQLNDSQKKMYLQVLAIQNLNFNEKLNFKLKEINKLNKISDNYNKGVVGIIFNLK